jgi:hypothetical protein
MFRIDPNRLDLAREFRERPFGIHSPDLQAVLTVMRSAPIDGKHVLVCTHPHRRWVLARMRLDPPRAELTDTVFTCLEEAEWTVFRLRWQEHTGMPLVMD